MSKLRIATLVALGIALAVLTVSHVLVRPSLAEGAPEADPRHEEPRSIPAMSSGVHVEFEQLARAAQEARQIGGTAQIGGTVSAAPAADAIAGETAYLQSQAHTSDPRTQSTVMVQEEATLQCPQYAGPMFFPYYPGAKNVPRRPVRVASRPRALDDQPTASPGSRTTLESFDLGDVRFAPDGVFAGAQRTNTAFLRLLDPDRLLFFFRRLARLPQPKPNIEPYGGWESQGSGLRGEVRWLHNPVCIATDCTAQLTGRPSQPRRFACAVCGALLARGGGGRRGRGGHASARSVRVRRHSAGGVPGSSRRWLRVSFPAG